jgi:hypothetical protein
MPIVHRRVPQDLRYIAIIATRRCYPVLKLNLILVELVTIMILFCHRLDHHTKFVN